MHNFSIDGGLERTLVKLYKKDIKTYKAVIEKIDEISNSADINHYKNLRKPLQHLKRVHVNGPFVLTFKYDASEDKVVFYDFDHHDKIYGHG